MLEKHIGKFEKLEQLVEDTSAKTSNRTAYTLNRPVKSIIPDPTTKQINAPLPQHFDINSFSEQEKRILSVFFQNQDMPLSYIDLARTLSKSSNTIKNQMRQIRLKADLFDKTIDSEQRNRFKLKGNMKVEKYLNLQS